MSPKNFGKTNQVQHDSEFDRKLVITNRTELMSSHSEKLKDSDEEGLHLNYSDKSHVKAAEPIGNVSKTVRKELLKKRNTEVKRNNREKWKKCDIEMLQLYNANEAEMVRLDELADGLKQQLHGSESGSQSSAKRRRLDTEQKPEWFGMPF